MNESLIKWAKKLTEEDFLAFHRKYSYADIESKCTIIADDDLGLVFYTVYEYGWGKRKNSMPTTYVVSDFEWKEYDTFGEEEESRKTNKGFIQFMTEKFGIPYLAEFLEYQTGIDRAFFANLIKEIRK